MPDYYGGPQLLRGLGNGVGYYEEATSVHFVSIPEPATGSILLLAGTMSLAVMRRQRP
jgi:hypothetical protein